MGLQAGIDDVIAGTDARVPKNDPHVQQLQRWLSDANTELASLRKRLSEQVGRPLRFKKQEPGKTLMTLLGVLGSGNFIRVSLLLLTGLCL